MPSRWNVLKLMLTLLILAAGTLAVVDIQATAVVVSPENIVGEYSAVNAEVAWRYTRVVWPTALAVLLLWWRAGARWAARHHIRLQG